MDGPIEPVCAFVPNYARHCENCNAVPTVDVVVNGRLALDRIALCGPCTWGEADMLDPSNW